MKQPLKDSPTARLTADQPSHSDAGYGTDFIDLVETVYGEGYLSQGGSEMVEKMFEGIDFDGQCILDLGCGVGGPALHLAKNHDVSVVGIDPEPLMIHKSQAALKQLCNTPIRGSASFAVMEDPLTLQQFPDHHFDIVTSKEAILHVPNAHKLGYYREIFRVLKKGGQIIMLDWQHRSPNYSDRVKAMMEMDGVPFHLNTSHEYRQVVKGAGFSDIVIDDFTHLLVEQTKKDLAIVNAKKALIIEKFGAETYEYALKSWSIQKEAFEDGELLVALIKATKR